MTLHNLPPLLRDEPGLVRALGDPSARLAINDVARPLSIAALAHLSNHAPLLVAAPLPVGATGWRAGRDA